TPGIGDTRGAHRGVGDADRVAGGHTPERSHEILRDRATLRDNGNPCPQIPPAGRVLLEKLIQNVARNSVLVNKRLSAACYRPQTLASNLAKSYSFQNTLLLIGHPSSARAL